MELTQQEKKIVVSILQQISVKVTEAPTIQAIINKLNYDKVEQVKEGSHEAIQLD